MPAVTVRGIRLVSGLVLFTYVTLHLIDHSLLNYSLEAAEAMLQAMRAVWQSPPGAVLLHGSLAAHLLLAFWALYERRHFQWRINEAVQLVLGFCIPVLLANHILATRVSRSLYGTEKGYAIELWSFWLNNLTFGAIQHLLLVVVWIHGCLGVWFWLRLKPWFHRVAPTLLGLAVLLPVLALLGSFQGSRRLFQLMQDPQWVASTLRPENVGTSAQNGILEDTRTLSWLVFAIALGVVLLARGLRRLLEQRRGMVRISYVEGRSVSIPRGLSVLEASRLHRVPHMSVCGGRGRCTTCRIRVFAEHSAHLPQPSRGEAAALARVGAEPHVRLACQLRPLADLRLSLLLPVGARERRMLHSGEERHLVLMFVDLRGSTAMAENRLPFDTVFLINSFLAAVGHAVTEAGGTTNQVIGDGLFGIFGLTVDRATAARQALAAASAIARNVRALNVEYRAELKAPLGYGIGINGGEVIIGDVGYESFTVFTALGDPVNVAARLEGMSKEFDCAAVVAEEICREAGQGDAAWGRHVVTPRGRGAELPVRALTEEDLIALAEAGREPVGPASGP